MDMKNTTLSYRTEFEAAYVQGTELHAHRYKIEVTIGGPQHLADHGKILDYKILAAYVNSVCPHNTYLVSESATDAENEIAAVLRKLNVDVLTCPYPLSIEYMCEGIASELQDILYRHEPGLVVLEVKLRETNDSYATWTKEPESL